MEKFEYFEIFKYLHEQESQRSSELISRANIFLAILALYFGTIFINKEKFFANWHKPESENQYLLYISLILFTIAFIVNIFALSFYKYQRIFEPEEKTKKLFAKNFDEHIFFEDLIIDLAVSTNNNFKKNNKRSFLLFTEIVILLIGTLFQCSYFLL